MKITQEHYDKLEVMIGPLANQIRIGRERLRVEGKAKDIETRLAWDAVHASRADIFVCDVLYKYLDDSHITTALKRIIGVWRD